MEIEDYYVKKTFQRIRLLKMHKGSIYPEVIRATSEELFKLNSYDEQFLGLKHSASVRAANISVILIHIPTKADGAAGVT